MNFLWIRATLNSAYGGPVAAIGQLIVALQDLGHQCEVVTLDAQDAPHIVGFPCAVHALGPSLGKYAFNTRLVNWLRRNAHKYDAVIVSGIWQFQSLATWLASKKGHFPYFVFIHGALDPWFKHTYPLKHLKKWLYWPWAEYQVLRDASAILFTNEEERRSASESFWLYKANEVVVNYGIAMPQGMPDLQRQLFFEKFPHLRDKRFFLFLGRIHPVKGCDILIDAFAQIAGHDPDIRLVIAGPDEAGLIPEFMRQAARHGIEDRITWIGMISGDLKWGAYRTADAFILPSHSENFGVVVAEALSCSLPVLITDKVNIWREVEDGRGGLVGPDTLDGITNLMRHWLSMSEVDKDAMRLNASVCFMKRFEIKMVAERFVDTMQSFARSNSYSKNSRG